MLNETISFALLLHIYMQCFETPFIDPYFPMTDMECGRDISTAKTFSIPSYSHNHEYRILLDTASNESVDCYVCFTTFESEDLVFGVPPFTGEVNKRNILQYNTNTCAKLLGICYLINLLAYVQNAKRFNLHFTFRILV